MAKEEGEMVSKPYKEEVKDELQNWVERHDVIMIGMIICSLVSKEVSGKLDSISIKVGRPNGRKVLGEESVNVDIKREREMIQGCMNEFKHATKVKKKISHGTYGKSIFVGIKIGTTLISVVEKVRGQRSNQIMKNEQHQGRSKYMRARNDTTLQYPI